MKHEPEWKSLHSDHSRIEERSLALHRAIAEKLLEDPSLLEKAKANIKKIEAAYLGQGQPLPRWLIEWKDIVDRGDIQELLSFMVSEDEKARRLRQSSPFFGILSPKERWQIYESFSVGTYYKGRSEHNSG